MIHNGKKIVNRKQLLKNIEEINKEVGQNKKICAMVKADAYGHGICEISSTLLNKCYCFGVSNINEALKIRILSLNAKILIVGKTYSFDECIKNNISFTIDSLEHFDKLIEFVKDKAYCINCINIHIKINTGMNRLGINSIDEFKQIYFLAKINKINIEGVSTHFATADCDIIFLKKQIKKFEEFLKEIPKDEKPIIHIGGSAVLNKRNQEYIKNLDFDMVRVGIAMYGYNSEKISKKIKPILKVESYITKILFVKKGEFVGYSRGFRAEKDMKVGIVPLGYGDGIPKSLSNKISVEVLTKDNCLEKHIHKCAVIGNICMDMFFIDITKDDFAKEGDRVIVVKNVKKWAKLLQTIPYEILTNFGLMR